MLIIFNIKITQYFSIKIREIKLKLKLKLNVKGHINSKNLA